MKIIYLFQKALCLGFFIFLLNGCSSEALKDSLVTSDVALLTTSSLSCNAQAEQTDYSILTRPKITIQINK